MIGHSSPDLGDAMKLHLLSDLHIEFADYEPDARACAAADVIVLAGDIDVGVKGIAWARRVFANKPVIYVCGNHEFYSGHWTATLEELRAAALMHGVQFLEDDQVVIGGVRFLGAALWTDFAYLGEQERPAAMAMYRSGLQDCRLIARQTSTVGRDPLQPSDVLLRHRTSREWLQRALSAAFSGPTVVVTHHLPHRKSVAARFELDPLTPGFASNLPESLITRADLWLHGHTHDSCHYVVTEGAVHARVVCNPRGYPLDRRRSRFENKDFESALLLEV
ncbi:metallophosphoesterase [Ramlibacter sp. MMS24-I3-19]|uniref:metallophosphoesterase n=1 Tax=Ramlibacter sp. MMS24-I3-19 TaxID=3416606 RepID=UPI003CFE03E3